uniref:Fibronectin type-III domain-containing protein n=1 Tax=Meloidogyne incognita TaxID=6306 RepID=A0A914L2Q9_MELIC
MKFDAGKNLYFLSTFFEWVLYIGGSEQGCYCLPETRSFLLQYRGGSEQPEVSEIGTVGNRKWLKSRNSEFRPTSATVHDLRNFPGFENPTRSVDIRNDPRNAFHQPRRNMKTDEDGKERKLKYRECTILEGDFTISMITRSNLTDDLFPVFENLREITGSILVFQIRGLTSLGRIFPNLRVIGGHSLIMNYALVVYQNYDLRDIGLTKLVAIKNGGVRITENPRLCYTRSISWKQILIGNIRDLIIDQVAGHCKNDCPTSENDPHCFRDPFTSNMACWNNTHCQRICINNQKTISGCTINDELCHEECIGGCTRPNDTFACFSCRHLDLNGQCVSKCPDHLPVLETRSGPGKHGTESRTGGLKTRHGYEQLGRRCLTKYECEALYPVTSYPSADEKSVWKAFKKHCSYECPNGYREDPLNSHSCIECINFCPKKCPGDTVDSISSALKFSKCNMIEGNLEIDMRIGIESTSAEKFTEAFGEIEEITGYLLIRFSSAFMSLHMFKKLRRIHGQQLWKNLYALVVFENQNLRQLFNVDEEHKIEILRGKISFQNNRMLCYDKIKNFIEHLGMKVCTEFGDENNKAKCVGESDVSPFSNGDKAICDEIPLEVKIVSVYSYGFVITWTPFNTTDMDHRKFLGYMIFYKKVDKINLNMTIDDDRSACSDSWSMYFVTDGSDSTKEDISGEDAGTSSPKGELINQGVEANTLYAVYVQTRVVNHPGAKNAISPILYVKTLFGVPDPPRMRASIALSPNSIKLNWDPPLEAYGDITHYMVLIF